MPVRLPGWNSRQRKAGVDHSCTRPDGNALPFGAEVLDTRNQVVGIVGQGSRIYLRTEAQKGLLQIKWGTQPTQQCSVSYSAKAQINNTDYEIIEASCK